MFSHAYNIACQVWAGKNFRPSTNTLPTWLLIQKSHLIHMSLDLRTFESKPKQGFDALDEQVWINWLWEYIIRADLHGLCGLGDVSADDDDWRVAKGEG